MTFKNRFFYIFWLSISSSASLGQVELGDSILLTFNNRSIIQPFENFDRIDSTFRNYKNDYWSYDWLRDWFNPDSLYFYETNFPFGRGMELEYEAGSNYTLLGDVTFIVSKETREINGLYATFQVDTRYDSLVNTPEYVCELITRVAREALINLQNIVECEDSLTFESTRNVIYERVVLEPPVPDDVVDFDPIYYVTYLAKFEK